MIVAGPDGKTIDFGDMPQDQVQSAMQKLYPSPTQQSMNANAFGAQATNPLAAVTGYGANVISQVPGLKELGSAEAAVFGKGQGNTFGERYNNLEQAQQSMREAGQQLYPGATTVGKVGANLATMGMLPAAETEGLSTLQKIAQGAKTGAGYGAAYGAGADGNSFATGQDASLERLKNAGLGAITGGTLGAAVPLVFANPSEFGGANNASDMLEETASGELPKYATQSSKNILSKANSGQPVTSADIKQHAQDVYQAAHDLGGTLTPQFAQDMLASWKGKEPVTPVEVANAKTDPLRAFAQNYEDAGFANQPVSLTDVESLDKALGQKAWNERDAFGNVSDDGRRFLQAQRQLRDAAQNATVDNGHAAGDTTGFDALKYGTQLYAQQAKMADIERIMDKAQNADNPTNAAKSGFRSLLNSGKRMTGYTDDEVQAIQNASKSGLAGGALNLMSSKIVPLVAAGTGHFDLGATALGLQAGTRALANKLQQGRAQNVIDTIANRNLGVQPDYVSLAAQRNAMPTNTGYASGGRIGNYSHKTWVKLVKEHGKEAKVKMSQLKDESARERLLNTAAKLTSSKT